MDELERPSPATVRFEAGQEVEHAGRRRLVVRQITLVSFLVEDLDTQERLQANISDLRPWTGGGAGPDRRRIPDLQCIPDEKREIGLKRFSALQSLMGMKYRTRQDVAITGEELNLSISEVYALLARLKREGTWTCLIPHIEKGKPRAKKLPKLVEDLIEEAIDRAYLDRHNAPMAEIVRETARLCSRAGVATPAPNSVKARIRSRDARSIVAARRGEKEARDRFGPVLGAFDEARWPLQSVQIDHTVVDFFVVDETTGQTIGRPILTLVIDEFSRAVLGFSLSLRPPSTLSVALALTQGVLLKDQFRRDHAIESPWDVFGIPDLLLSDNAAEFDSRGLAGGCAQYGIHGVFRPLGKPHFGGRIERLIGTIMGRVKLMPGATMRSIAERGDGYDPEQGAAYTIAEAETRIAIEICDIYHRSIHSATGTTPLKLWEFGILGDDKTPGRGSPRLPGDPQRFLVDFLPAEQRTVQDYGIQLNHVRYHAPILRAFVAGRKGGRQFIIRYDPRDLRSVFFYDPDNAEYHVIPRANAHYPAVALWEVKAATKHLKSQGQDPDDEQAMQRAIERMRQMDEDAVFKSKKARRNAELRRQDARDRAKPFPRPSPPPHSSAEQEIPATQDELPAGAERRRVRPIEDVEGW